MDEQYVVVCMDMHHATGPYGLPEALQVCKELGRVSVCEFIPVPYKPVLEDAARTHTGQYL